MFHEWMMVCSCYASSSPPCSRLGLLWRRLPASLPGADGSFACIHMQSSPADFLAGMLEEQQVGEDFLLVI